MIKWLVIAFVAGLSFGIMAAGKFSPDWVEATGTWVGAIATVGAIVWAVHSFQQERRQKESERTEALLEQDKKAALEAQNVIVKCYGGGSGVDGNK